MCVCVCVCVCLCVCVAQHTRPALQPADDPLTHVSTRVVICFLPKNILRLFFASKNNLAKAVSCLDFPKDPEILKALYTVR